MAGTRDVALLTGSGGFIESAAAARLSERFDVIGFDLNPSDDPNLAHR
jgi:nucleoside-diphosphate-sugar epimerase